MYKLITDTRMCENLCLFFCVRTFLYVRNLLFPEDIWHIPPRATMGRTHQELIYCFSSKNSHNALLKSMCNIGIKRLSNFYATLTGEHRIYIEHLYIFSAQ